MAFEDIRRTGWSSERPSQHFINRTFHNCYLFFGCVSHWHQNWLHAARIPVVNHSWIMLSIENIVCGGNSM